MAGAEGNRNHSGSGHGQELRIAASFVVAMLAAVGLAALYSLGGQVQLEGLLLFLALGGLAYGLGLWARTFMPGGDDQEERHDVTSTDEERRAFAEEFDRGEKVLERRSLLTKLLGGALGTVVLALLFPFRSLGPRPLPALRNTPWRDGLRLVTIEGSPVKAADVHVGTMLTVFPEGLTHAADAQTIVIRLEPGTYRAGGEVDGGVVAFSKICTHAGCPVGLYQVETKQLLCPCHQSVFDVVDGARPVEGPATRALPQLPIMVDEEGFLRARGDFPIPVGPGFWSFK